MNIFLFFNPDDILGPIANKLYLTKINFLDTISKIINEKDNVEKINHLYHLSSITKNNQ